jgi:glutamate-1-semialdehyde aminotransferase
MQWMGRLHAPHAIFFERARGNRITDVDGNEMLDFCLGDTGAMAGEHAAALRVCLRCTTWMGPRGLIVMH